MKIAIEYRFHLYTCKFLRLSENKKKNKGFKESLAIY